MFDVTVHAVKNGMDGAFNETGYFFSLEVHIILGVVLMWYFGCKSKGPSGAEERGFKHCSSCEKYRTAFD